MNKEYEPLISIIIPTYNRGIILSETLDSVLSQTYLNWECLIIDDGSTDDTLKIVKSYYDHRIKYFYQERGERSTARNYGIRSAKGEFLQFLDSDDLISPRKLEMSVLEIKKRNYKERKVIISNFRVKKENSESTIDPYCQITLDLLNFQDILYKWDVVFTIPIHCALFHRSLFEKFRFPSQINYKEDWLMWLFIFQQDIAVYFINEPLAIYRIRGNVSQEEKNLNGKKEIKVLKLLEEYIPERDLLPYYFSLIEKRQEKILQLQNSLINYRNTRTFKYSNAIKKFIQGIKIKYQKWI